MRHGRVSTSQDREPASSSPGLSRSHGENGGRASSGPRSAGRAGAQNAEPDAPARASSILRRARAPTRRQQRRLESCEPGASAHGEAGESRSARRESAAARRASRSGPRSTTARRGENAVIGRDARRRLGMRNPRDPGEERHELVRRPRTSWAGPRSTTAPGGSGSRRAPARGSSIPTARAPTQRQPRTARFARGGTPTAARHGEGARAEKQFDAV
jgi:hypothetical protein